MFFLIGAIAVLGIAVALFSLLGKNTQQPVKINPTCSTCTGDDSRCEQECMMEAATKEIEYYDDEHLDKYADRPSDGYTDDEVEEFAEVLYTMQQADVKGWNRSLILRNINIPDQLKDELIALISEK